MKLTQLHKNSLCAVMVAVAIIIAPSAHGAAVVSGLAPTHALDAAGPRPDWVSTPRSKEAKTEWEQALARMAAGQLDEAAAGFANAAKLEPYAVAPLLGLADVAVRRGKTTEALKLVEKAQKLAPDVVEVRIAAGRLAYAVGKKSDAEEHFKRAAVANPAIAAPLLDLGEFYMAERRPADAVGVFTTAAALKSPHPGASFGLGRALVATGNDKAAMVAFEQAAKLAPGNPLPLMAMAELHFKGKDSKQALVLLDKVLAQNPSLVSARLARADVLAAQGAREQARLEYLAMLGTAHGADAALLHAKLAALKQAAQDTEGAIAALKQAIKADPKFHPAYNDLAWLAAERKRDLDNGLKWAKLATELAPKSATYLDTLGYVLLARGDKDGAVSALRRAIALSPETPDYHYRLGLALQAQSQTQAALGSYEAALKTGKPFRDLEDTQRRIASLSGNK
ncbi:tetratricopeptide repeat protein [Rhodoferax sp.]|uniref:tetratricopeptide repeat protein n=1 Tax=Rhodoferax sp. TaxID=50421 RepID=UPI00276CFB3F|nr:tetratricopeptide repeat protein [Rhodoferax sp.]